MPSRVWKKGPPPHVGWWNASCRRYEFMWRWWDGKQWSKAVHEDSGPRRAAEMARSAFPLSVQYLIQWTTYYPKNARVPRIDPRKAKPCDTK